MLRYAPELEPLFSERKIQILPYLRVGNYLRKEPVFILNFAVFNLN